MPTPSGLLLHPRRTLDAVASRPRLLPAALVVAASGEVSLAFEQLASAISPKGFTAPPPLLYAALPALLLAFWALSGWLIDAGARLMARASKRRGILAASGQCFVIFAAYGLVTALQALALRLGAGSGGAWAVGWLTAPLLLWFVALLVVAVVSVYSLEPPSALALALLPFGGLLAALLLYSLMVAVLATVHVG